jgi:two-component system sensor histidine kinase TctE
VVTVQVAADAQGCSLAVLDDGPGVDADLLPRLSQRFAKGRGSSGSGLGLAIAQSVMERHGGQLRVQARDDGPGLKAVLWWPHP